MCTLSLEEKLQEAVVDTLSQNTELMELITGIFDEVPSGQGYPYIQIGNVFTIDASTFSRSKWDIDMDIVCYDKPGGAGFSTLNRIAGLIRNSLHEKTLSLGSNFEMVGCKYVNSSRFRMGDTRQVTVTFLVYVESTIS